MGGLDIQKSRRENLRWLILRTLHSARPIGTTEQIILQTVQGLVPDTTQFELRQELDYLDDRKLIEISERDTPVWFAKINHHGVDVVEYTVDCQPGIARPAKYWD